MNVCRDDVHDRAPVRQGHVSVSPFTLFEVACEHFLSLLFPLSPLTRGRFDSSLCLCLCLCFCLCPSDAFQDVSTQTSDQQVSSIFFDVAVQTSFHGIHTSSLKAAVQTIPHSTLSQHVSTQMGSRPASSFSLDVFVQTPIRSTVAHDTSTQQPLTEFFIGCIFSNDPFDRQKLCSSVAVISTR